MHAIYQFLELRIVGLNLAIISIVIILSRIAQPVLLTTALLIILQVTTEWMNVSSE